MFRERRGYIHRHREVLNQAPGRNDDGSDTLQVTRRSLNGIIRRVSIISTNEIMPLLAETRIRNCVEKRSLETILLLSIIARIRDATSTGRILFFSQVFFQFNSYFNFDFREGTRFVAQFFNSIVSFFPQFNRLTTSA